jgi:hypothetical protein
MPPKARQNSSNFAEKEERILLAISALEKQKICNICEAARFYNVSRTTLQRRLNGTASRAETRANSYKMTQIEEESLVRWILLLIQRGAPPRPSQIQEIADILLAARGTTPIQSVSKNWVSNFIKRRKDLKT